jgi:hypothetical protein
MNGKILYSTKVDGLSFQSTEIQVGVYGMFKSTPGKGEWSYYLISFINTKNGSFNLTPHWHSFLIIDVTYESIKNNSKQVSCVEDGQKLCDEYKQRWVTGGNNTVQELRDSKLTKILT